MNGEYVDALLVYNMQPTRVHEVNAWLKIQGVTTSLLDLNNARDFQNGACTVLFLDQTVWNTAQLVNSAFSKIRNAPVLPVLIGEPSKGTIEGLSRMFQFEETIDLREGEESLRVLRDQILRHARTSINRNENGATSTLRQNMDPLIQTLIDGSEGQRHGVLTTVRQWKGEAAALLGARLRMEVEGPFSPSYETKDGGPLRDPARLASSRAWMISVLLACDPGSPDTVSLIRRELSESYEPDPNVRFWALAACYWERVPYLYELVSAASHDSSLPVSLLAITIDKPQPKEAIIAFRDGRDNGEPDKLWAALRVMRVTPIPALVEPLDRVPGRGVRVEIHGRLGSQSVNHGREPCRLIFT